MPNIRTTLKAAIRRLTTPAGLAFDRPLLLFQSDDWGRAGVRDREGWENLRAAGVNLGERPYDFYSLETAEDVAALRELFRRHRDSVGRSPCAVMNFIVANVDFAKAIASDFKEVCLKRLVDGLPGNWARPGLDSAYRRGIADGVFYPALHGSSHFCWSAVTGRLAKNGEDADLLRALWSAGTPYIYWRMPWIGYEYWNPEHKEFVDASHQEALIRESAEFFEKMFGVAPFSACAPGYRANGDTHRAWEQRGVRVAQNGSGGVATMHLDGNMLNTYRNVDFEPATEGEAFSLGTCLRKAQENLDRGIPAVVSVHSINFHSTLRDYRTPTLKLLDQFLTILEVKYPDLLYVHDADLYQIVTTGKYERPDGATCVNAVQGSALRFSGGRS
jgi:hypothetical protein